MNCNEWKLARKNGTTLDWSFYTKTREIQKSLQYNPDPNAVVIHHLRDTEEQRKYNDEHYELWGHNLDGTFEYGKYVVFWTEEDHFKYHHMSEETRRVMSTNTRAARDQEWIENQRQKHLGKKASEETKKKMSDSHKKRWENEDLKSRSHEFNKWTNERKASMSEKFKSDGNPFYGKHHSPGKFAGENNGMYGKHHTDKARDNMSKNRTGDKNGMYGKTHSEDSKKKMSNAIKIALEKCSAAYKEYKSNGGTMKWNDFRRWYRDNANN